MRPSSSAVYRCRRSGDRGMHRWERTLTGARCTFCSLALTGEDAEDVFRGARTPIGQVRGRMPGLGGDGDDLAHRLAWLKGTTADGEEDEDE